jgi:hypothetical protein
MIVEHAVLKSTTGFWQSQALLTFKTLVLSSTRQAEVGMVTILEWQ